MFVIPFLWIQVLGGLVSLLLLVVFALPLITGFRNAGSVAGTLFSLLLSIYFVLNQPVAAALNRIWENEIGHFLLCIFVGFLAVSLAAALVLSLQMLCTIRRKPKTPHICVVLGCQVQNRIPNTMLERRAEAACRYLALHAGTPVILCGGNTVDGNLGEAEWMQQYLKKHAIMDNPVFLDTASGTTKENLVNAKNIIQEQEWEPVVTIITDGFHQRRAAIIAKELGLQTYHLSSKTPWLLLPSCWVREWIYLCKHFIFG